MLDAKVVELRDDFSKRTAEAEALKVSLQKAEETLGAAQTLLEKLSGERGRWEEMAAEYNEEMRSIAGSENMPCVAAATILAAPCSRSCSAARQSVPAVLSTSSTRLPLLRPTRKVWRPGSAVRSRAACSSTAAAQSRAGARAAGRIRSLQRPRRSGPCGQLAAVL